MIALLAGHTFPIAPTAPCQQPAPSVIQDSSPLIVGQYATSARIGWQIAVAAPQLPFATHATYPLWALITQAPPIPACLAT
jgi:hypothetical protein